MARRAAPAPRSGYEDQVGAHPSPWKGATATADILLNNLGVGTFVVATACLLWDRSFREVAAVAWPLAFALVAADLLVLALDLGDPWRAFHMLRVVKPETPMSVGVWSLSALMACLAVPALAGFLSWFVDLPSWLDSLALGLAAVGLVPAIGALLYKGVLFSTTAQPGWRDARWFGGYVAASALGLGSACAGLVAAVLGEDAAVDVLGPLTAALAIVSVVAYLLLRRDLAPEEAGRFTAGRRTTTLAVAVAGPLAAGALALTGWAPAQVGVAVLLVATAWVVRRAFVDLPHTARRA
jgi:hypothetical protein